MSEDAPEQANREDTVFVSYRRDDSADVVGRIIDRLHAGLVDHDIFRDVDDIPLGADFQQAISEKVGTATVVLVAIGPRWLTATSHEGTRRLDDPNDFVRLEVQAAVQRDIPVIPLLVGGAEMPSADSLPEGLRPLAFRNGIPIRPDPDFDNDVRRLMSALEKQKTGERDKRIAELDSAAAAAEASHDWAAATAALARLADLAPDYPGLTERIAEAQSRSSVTTLTARAERAADEGRWSEVLALIHEIRTIDPNWKDQDRLEEAAHSRQSLTAARALFASGDLVAARGMVDDLLDREQGDAELTALSAEIDAALAAKRRRRTMVAISAVVVVAVAVAAVVGLLTRTSDEGTQPVAGGDSSEQQTGEQPTNGQQTDGPQSTTSTPVSASPVFLEVEDGDVSEPMTAKTNPQACANGYVSSVEGGGPDDEEGGAVTVGFDIEEAGTYVFWGRVAAGGGRVTSSDSLFVSIDGGPEDTWDFRQVEGPTAGWEWDGISLRCGGDFGDHRCDPWEVHLEPGRHTLTFRTREPLSQLDAIFVAGQGSGDQPPTPC